MTFQFLNRPWVRGGLLGLLVGILLAPLAWLGPGRAAEHLWLDFCYQRQAPRPAPADLLLVGIDEASFQEVRRPWPWPRRLHAELIDRLHRAGARLIIFDVLFADPSSREDDDLFAAALERAGNVILIKTVDITADRHFHRRILVEPLEVLRRAARGVGLAMVTPDRDGVVRRFWLELEGQSTLARLAAREVRSDLSLPAGMSGLIDYAGPPRSLETVSYAQIMDAEHPVPADKVRDRIVLVGRMLEASATPQGQADAFLTPFYSLTGQLMTGVEIHGNIIHTLLTGRVGREMAPGLWLLLMGMMVVSGAGLFARLSVGVGLAVLLLQAVLLLGGAALLFASYRFWFPPILITGGLVLVYGGNALGHYLVASREKRWLRRAFSRYVSRSVVEIITAHPERLQLGGEEVEVTVLFSDLAGFTSLSERLTPPALIQLLNEYFHTMTEIIMARQGTVDKYIGDAIMAFWGAPVDLPDHARQACRAALAMRRALEPLQHDWQGRGLPLLQARLGLHTGPAVVGNVGSRERFNYTVMGDAVNLASRLEGVNKVYGTEILVSDATLQAAGNSFWVRELDAVQVKGRGQAVTVSELIGEREEEAPGWLGPFQTGRKAYLARHWDEAAARFQEVLQLNPGDGPAELFLSRCREFQRQAPPPEWNGVVVLESK